MCTPATLHYACYANAARSTTVRNTPRHAGKRPHRRYSYHASALIMIENLPPRGERPAQAVGLQQLAQRNTAAQALGARV